MLREVAVFPAGYCTGTHCRRCTCGGRRNGVPSSRGWCRAMSFAEARGLYQPLFDIPVISGASNRLRPVGGRGCTGPRSRRRPRFLRHIHKASQPSPVSGSPALPETTSLTKLVRLANIRWRIEHNHSESTTGLGLAHFEGRTLAGWHHHATFVTAAHTYITPPQPNSSSLRCGSDSHQRQGQPESSRHPRRAPTPRLDWILALLPTTSRANPMGVTRCSCGPVDARQRRRTRQ